MAGVVDEEGRVSNKKEDIERMVQGVKRWFTREGNRNWLLAFDNVDDLESFDIGSFIPSPSHGTVIMTSRRRECVRFGTGVAVEVMSESEGVLLLLRTAQLQMDPVSPEGKAFLR